MLTPLDMLPHLDLAEKLIGLSLQGPPAGLGQTIAAGLVELSEAIAGVDPSDIKVVVLGGGTGLSNIVGGDSRSSGWPKAPFLGLKDVFPRTTSIVCVTDDGGSTGELQKDLPLIGLGDIRHVLLSSIKRRELQQRYGLDEIAAARVITALHSLFNYRFVERPVSPTTLLAAAGVDLALLPEKMAASLGILVRMLFAERELAVLLDRPHCLGNLLLAAAIYLRQQETRFVDGSGPPEISSDAVIHELTQLGVVLGAGDEAVLPCTTTPACLQVLYSNGVLVTGEHKSGNARRDYAVDRVFVGFTREPQVPAVVKDCLRAADIIVLAPGSLYSSTIPVLQVPGLAAAIRKNDRALKLLVANLWVQKGETDLVRGAPLRRFYVSDLIKAYHRNIPGGVKGLFDQVLTLGLKDIPGSILQNYAMEGKLPIYLDRDGVRKLGFVPVEAGIFSQSALQERQIIHHDPDLLARAIQTLWAVRDYVQDEASSSTSQGGLPAWHEQDFPAVNYSIVVPTHRFSAINRLLTRMTFSVSTEMVEEMVSEAVLRSRLADILWRHWDIQLDHLDNVQGIMLIDGDAWRRCQAWDNVFSFYDPDDGRIKIRQDAGVQPEQFEIAFLVALGQALLGNYAAEKRLEPVERDGELLGKVYHLILRPPSARQMFFSADELDRYLVLSRMVRSSSDSLHYTRLVNGNEGFTPPGMLLGLTYAWYLDNRFAAHVEYKMAVMRNEMSDLIPEQIKMYSRRRSLIDFFREVVFRYSF